MPVAQHYCRGKQPGTVRMTACGLQLSGFLGGVYGTHPQHQNVVAQHVHVDRQLAKRLHKALNGMTDQAIKRFLKEIASGGLCATGGLTTAGFACC